MISLRFLKRVVGLPYVIVRAVVQFYTLGTVYSRTNREFHSSLYKNVHLAVEHHLANNFSRDDVARWVYTPVSTLVEKYRTHPLAARLPGYGDQIDTRTYWIVRAAEPDVGPEGLSAGAGDGENNQNSEIQNSENGSEAQNGLNDNINQNKGNIENILSTPGGKSAVLYLHGGGFCLNVFAAQFVALLALPYAVPDPQRSLVSIAIVDYSLTCHYDKYPTQIHQAMESYRALVNAGYTRITLMGDSAGTNLALALARFTAYPEEAAAHFSGYPQFQWDFTPVVQPENLVFVSPWLEPYTVPTAIPGVNTDGDLGAIDTQMGDWYVEGLDRDQLAPFVNFTATNYAAHWAKVGALNGEGRTLYIYGEREILRHGVERFVDTITKDGAGKLEVYMEPGGIHDGLFYVESLDYLTSRGARSAQNGDFADKYAFNLVGQFLAEVC